MKNAGRPQAAHHVVSTEEVKSIDASCRPSEIVEMVGGSRYKNGLNDLLRVKDDMVASVYDGK